MSASSLKTRVVQLGTMVGLCGVVFLSACSNPITPTAEPRQVVVEPTKTTQPAQVSAPTEQTQVVTPTATLAAATPRATSSPTNAPPSSTAVPTRAATATPTSTNTPRPLLPSPSIVKPDTRSSYAWKSPVSFSWNWVRGLEPDEFFQFQLSKIDYPWVDFACTRSTTLLIAQAPFEYGWYQWRTLVRRGSFQGSECTASEDVSAPSEIRTFEWREQPGPVAPPPVSPPYP